jgi:hypothetical protein
MAQTQSNAGFDVGFDQQVPAPPEQRAPVELTPGAEPFPGVHAAPVGKGRRWLWLVVAGIATIAVMAAALAALLGGSADTDQAGGTMTVIDEDFSTGTGPFEEFEEDGFVAQHRGGGYEVTAAQGESTYWSSAAIDRSTSVDISARLDLVAGAHPDAAVGLSVEPNRTEAYFLSLFGDGTVALGRAVDDEEFVLPLTMTTIKAVDGAATLRLTVVASGNGTEVTGWVDGEQVVRHDHEQGWDSFRGVGVVVVTGPEPGTVHADDVVVKISR